MRPHLSTEVAVEGGRSAAGGSGAQLLPSHSFFHLSDPPARRRSLCRHFKTLSSPSLLPPWLPTSASEAPGAHSSRRASRRVTCLVPTHAALLPARAGPAPRSHSAMPAPLLPAPAVPRMAAILSACPEPPACCLWLPPRCRGDGFLRRIHQRQGLLWPAAGLRLCSSPPLPLEPPLLALRSELLSAPPPGWSAIGAGDANPAQVSFLRERRSDLPSSTPAITS